MRENGGVVRMGDSERKGYGNYGQVKRRARGLEQERWLNEGKPALKKTENRDGVRMGDLKGLEVRENKRMWVIRLII